MEGANGHGIKWKYVKLDFNKIISHKEAKVLWNLTMLPKEQKWGNWEVLLLFQYNCVESITTETHTFKQYKFLRLFDCMTLTDGREMIEMDRPIGWQIDGPCACDILSSSQVKIWIWICLISLTAPTGLHMSSEQWDMSQTHWPIA